MQFRNTIQAMQVLGANVVTEARRNLKKLKKETRDNTLYNDMNYVVTSDSSNVELEWRFGGASDYWDLVNEGVKGSGGFKGSGKMRGQGSPYSFKKKNIGKGVVLKWIANKPLKLRNAKGQFTSRKSMKFAIAKSVYHTGIETTDFFQNAFYDRIDTLVDNIEVEIENLILDSIDKINTK